MSDSEPTLPDFPESMVPIYSAVVEVFALDSEFLGFMWTFSDGLTRYEIVPIEDIVKGGIPTLTTDGPTSE